MKKRDIRVCAIRWDAWYGHDGDPGSVVSQVENTLSPARYHHRIPFFGRVTPEGRAYIPPYTQEIFDREMQFAIESGIDIFTFVWYNDAMRTARELYLTSKYRDKVKMSVCLGGASPQTKQEVCDLIGQPFFATVDGHPLMFYFATFEHAKDDIAYFREYCNRNNIPEPYAVVMNLGADDTRASGANAIGQYGVNGSGGKPFTALAQDARNLRDTFMRTGMDFVPTVSAGWHNLPRYENPVSWIKLSEGSKDSWVQYPTGEELCDHLTETFSFMNRDDVAAQTKAGVVSIYAWNEHDEGGWICPTVAVDEQGNMLCDASGNVLINRERLDGIKRAISSYREEEK